jgi:ribosomal protein S27AE
MKKFMIPSLLVVMAIGLAWFGRAFAQTEAGQMVMFAIGGVYLLAAIIVLATKLDGQKQKSPMANDVIMEENFCPWCGTVFRASGPSRSCPTCGEFYRRHEVVVEFEE